MASDDNNNGNNSNDRQRACRPPRNNNDNIERRPATFEEVLDCELQHLTGASSGESLYTGTECRSDDHSKCDSAYASGVVAKAHNARLSGLAFSGGGIRSATFNLGVLQTLAKLNLLKEFHYLSTVSGGGYIGSWLAAWIQREDQNLVQCGETLEGGEQATEERHRRCQPGASNFRLPRRKEYRPWRYATRYALHLAFARVFQLSNTEPRNVEYGLVDDYKCLLS
jgi:hypothetical protein